MRPRLLDLLVCPTSGHAFALEVESSAPRETGDYGNLCARHGGESDGPIGLCRECYGVEVLEGVLRCTGCAAAYPVIGGVPRVLEPTLLATLKERHGSYFARHPEFGPSPLEAGVSEQPVLDTMDSFTRQRLDFRPPGPQFAEQWRAHLAKVLGDTLSPAQLGGQLIVDLGSGFGRHLYAAAEQGAEIVGVDLSGGVEVAWQNTLEFPKVHLVQANLLASPLVQGSFDVAWSFGVLHHLPDPRAGFRALVQLARPDGGLVAIWVYGYEGMALTYRLSHMRAIRRLLAGQGSTARVLASKLVAAALSLLYWLPLRVLVGLGMGERVRRLPLSEQAVQSWSARVSAVHDRLSTPITHYHDRPELLDWCAEEGLDGVVVTDTNRRGWRASGLRQGSTSAVPSESTKAR